MAEIKNYIHSRVETKIIDQSIVELPRSTPIGFTLFQPFLSDEGEDGKLKYFFSADKLLDYAGVPVFKRHGQALLNAHQWLDGGGTLIGLRVVADDAKPAFGLLNIRTKPTKKKLENADGSENEVDALMISPTFVPVPDEIITKEILTLPKRMGLKAIFKKARGMSKSSGDNVLKTKADGWKDNYIGIFRVSGAGKYGNDFCIQFVLDQSREEDIFGSRRYFYTVYRKDATGNPIKAAPTMSVSLDPNALDPSGYVSEFIETRIKTRKYIEKFESIDIHVSDEAYDELTESFIPYCEKVSDANTTGVLSKAQEPREIDYFQLTDKEGAFYARFLPPSPEEYAALKTAGDAQEVAFNLPMAYLAGGSDGGLDRGNYKKVSAPNPSNPLEVAEGEEGEKEITKKINNLKNDLLKRAYAGNIDSNILSPYKYQISCVLDGNFADDVKREMIYLCRRRLDVIAYLDLGFVSSVEAAINKRRAVFGDVYDMHGTCWAQSGQVYDKFSKRLIDATLTYELAYMIPNLRRTAGPNRLMAGTKKGRITFFKNFNWIPDEDEKTDLMKAQINYVEDTRLDEYFIMSNRTMYKQRLSYLAVIRNCHAITESIWVGRQILTDLRFEEDPGIAMQQAEELITRALTHLIEDGPCDRLIVKTEQTLEDAYENAASATIEEKFKDFIHTWRFNVVAAR